jgi:hypothetical protein
MVSRLSLTVQPSANATTTSPGPAAASTWTPPVALVARSLAMEWPSLGVGFREMALVQCLSIAVTYALAAALPLDGGGVGWG